MATDNKSIKIPAPLESATTGGYVTTAKDIVDEQQGKSQEMINEKLVADLGEMPSGTQNAHDRITLLWNTLQDVQLNTEGVVQLDETPTKNSSNFVNSGGIYPLKESLNNLAVEINGGELHEEFDGKNLVNSAEYYLSLYNGSLKRDSSASYHYWVIPNDNYSTISAKLRFDTSSIPGSRDAIVFIAFRVGDDFVYDSSKGYIYAKNGGTFIKDGVEYTIYNNPAFDFIYYPAHTASVKTDPFEIIDFEIPEGVISIYCTTRGASGTYITLKRNSVEGGIVNNISNHERRIGDLENRTTTIDDLSTGLSELDSIVNEHGEAIESINTELSSISGGERELEFEGTSLSTAKSKPNYVVYLKNGSVKWESSGSYTYWKIPNEGYSSISAKVSLNSSPVPNSGDAMVCICFIVNGTFEYDASKGYIYAQQGGTYTKDGIGYTINNTSGYNIVYYEEDTVSTKKAVETIRREIPDGTTTILVCTRTSGYSSANGYVTLYKTLHEQGLVDTVQVNSSKIEVLEDAVGELKEESEKTIASGNNEQDCLILRNYINEHWPYYFDNNEEVTDYTKTQGYLDKRISDVPEGKHFIFITDGHWKDNPTRSTKTSTYIASYVSKRLGGCPVVFGGDCINSEVNKYLAAKAFSEYADVFFSAFGDTGLWVQGNHDSNRLGIGDGITAETALVDDLEIYKRSVARIAHKVTFDKESIDAIQDIGLSEEDKANAESWLKLHYHWDDNYNKVRYIVYETGCAGVTLYKLVRTGTSYMLPLLYGWLSRTLLSTPNDYDIVILGHMFGQKFAEYTEFGTNTDPRILIKLVRAFLTKQSIKVNMREVNTTGGTVFTRALCGTSQNRTFDFSESGHLGKIFMVSGHWHNDVAYMCRYYENIDGVDGQNGVNVQRYSSEDVTEDTVIHINVACDTAYNNRNTYYTDRPSMAGAISECLFDVMTITDDDKLVCTRIGYGSDREFLLSASYHDDGAKEQDLDWEDDGGSEDTSENWDDIQINNEG